VRSFGDNNRNRETVTATETRSFGCCHRFSLLVLLLFAIANIHAAARDLGSDTERAAGQKLYLKFCAQCHGEQGNGAGVAAPHLAPAPRDFTTGKFKIRTTPNGALPTTEDLENIIRRGMPYTSMPPWPNFGDEELRNLAYFVKTFSSEFASPEASADPIAIPKAPSPTKESTEHGRKVYEDGGCVRCHGNLGRGDGPSAPTLVDDLGHPIPPADLTKKWTFVGGGSREDIFRTLSTGLNGTPMPSYADALTPEERWSLTDYIDSLSDGGGPGYANLLLVAPVDEPIDLALGAAAFESASVARFPIIGQITEPGRSFHPRATSVEVQAIRDQETIAFLVRWHDRSAETTGQNGPAFPVPPEEDESPASSAAAPAADGSDPWGEEAAPAPAPAGGGEDVWGEAEAPAAPRSEFSDAVALQIPAQIPTGARKPYFLFGDAQNAVDLWFFDLARTEPVQLAGRGSADVTPNDTGEVTGVAKYDQGEWAVVFQRPLRSDSGILFQQGQFVPVAFSIWDGRTRERGSRRGTTAWFHLYVQPEVVESAVAPMIRIALFVFALEVVVVVWVRRRFGAQKGSAIAAERMQETPS